MLKHAAVPSEKHHTVLLRSRLLTDTCWTPLRDVPSHKKINPLYFHPAGLPVTGMPYSSTEATDKYIGEHISFETFFSAVQNPHSVLYTKDIRRYKNGSTFYGTVCNGLVRFSLGISERYNTKLWYTIPGMTKIADKGMYRAEDIRLCDILHAFNDGRNHVALITDLLYDENGSVAMIEVSEAIQPHCVRRQFPPEVFFTKYAPFGLWRYEYIDQVPDLTEEERTLFQKGASAFAAPVHIALNIGNRTNCLESDEILITNLSRVSGTVQLIKDGIPAETVSLASSESRRFVLQRGTYTAFHKESGETLTFRVNRPQISHSVSDGLLTIHADPRDIDSALLYIDIRGNGTPVSELLSVEPLTKEEQQSGKVVRPLPEGAEQFKVYFRNSFGFWTSGLQRIEI